MRADETSTRVATLPPDAPDAVRDFLRLSAELTGFTDVELLGTGMVRPYYDRLLLVIGSREAGSLLGAFNHVAGKGAAAFRAAIIDSPRYGPVAKNLTAMWYLGTWSQLPREWRDAFGATSFDVDCVVSAKAYQEGLVWPAAGTHPMSAKQPGYGSWAKPSSVAPIPEEAS